MTQGFGKRPAQMQRQARRSDHAHLYGLDGRCGICGKIEPRRFSWLEMIMFAFMVLFLSWATFVVLYLQYWRR